jgi:membrane protease YdiL (CAAX protease family)
VGGDPREVLLQALQESPPDRLDQRQQALLSLLSAEPVLSPDLPPKLADDALLVRLRCEAAGGSAAACNDTGVSQAAALRLGLSVSLPLLSVIAGVVLLLRQGWLRVFGRHSPWPPVRGPALTLVDMVLLVAGGFVVISAVGVPVVAAPLVRSLTSGLASPRREALGVVIQYGVMALPSLLILRRQLRALPSDQHPADGWLQWKFKPVMSAMGSAVAGWLMVTPVVMLTGWLLVKIVGDPGGSNPLLELVLGSRDPLALVLLAFTAVVLAPLFEELIFRGALLPVLADRLGAITGVVLSALLFGLAHISIGELAPLTVLGIGLALVRLSTGRLFPCVLMHALWNAITFVNLLLL